MTELHQKFIPEKSQESRSLVYLSLVSELLSIYLSFNVSPRLSFIDLVATSGRWSPWSPWSPQNRCFPSGLESEGRDASGGHPGPVEVETKSALE